MALLFYFWKGEINVDEIKPNSHKSKREQEDISRKRVTKAITGNVTMKQSGLRKFTNAFISEDAPNIKSYVVSDVLIPAVKKLFFDIITNGADMLFYGGNGSRNRSDAARYGYASYWDKNKQPSRDRGPSEPPRSTRFTYDDIRFTSRHDAVLVLQRMDEIMAEYGTVRVADMFDLVGKTGEFTDMAYGWYDIREARVESGRDGWRIVMPKAQPIRR